MRDLPVLDHQHTVAVIDDAHVAIRGTLLSGGINAPRTNL
jgi:hypothetical protein